MANTDIAIKGTPSDLRATERLVREEPFEFESWAIMRMPGFVPNTVRTGDGGVEGRRDTGHHADRSQVAAGAGPSEGRQVQPVAATGLPAR